MSAFSRAAPRVLGLAAAAAAFVVDQADKYWMLHVFGIASRAPVRVASFFDLVMAWNQGISYSLFTTRTAEGRWILLGATLAATAALGLWMWRTRDRVTCVGLGLIVGGALGNALDRWRFGAVADFFYFHIGSFSWYVFNLADCAIVAGVALLLYESFFLKEKPRAKPA